MNHIIGPGLLIAAACLCSVALQCAAENLGQYGHGSEVDRDGREQLKDRARQIPPAKLEKFWRDYKDKTVNAIINPDPLGIRTDMAPRAIQTVPVFTMPFDAKDDKGRVLVKRGTQFRPLDLAPLAWGLIFIDGRDPSQVKFAIEQAKKRHLKIVLTAGSAYNLRQQYRNANWIGGTKSIPFYFDQKRMLINQLKQVYGISIQSVPAQLYMVRGDNRNALRIVFGEDRS